MQNSIYVLDGIGKAPQTEYSLLPEMTHLRNLDLVVWKL